MKFTFYLLFLLIPSLMKAANPAVGSCNCWLTRDTSWHVVAFDASGGSGGPGLPPEYRNDDWSSDTMHLPFVFCFYGDTVRSVFINNNGNVSIGTPYSTFTALSFPDPTYSMVAPFWADADTRGLLSGIVYYKIFPHYIAVQWDSVGYYSSHDDKRNTFQLIISDGGASPLPENKNIGFCYKNMEWTTGDASQGVNGFGGVPATVGVNYGDGVNYLQIGLYDNASISYDGPYGTNDGVASLTEQSFAFNVCVSNFNVPPILSGQYICDTIDICIGDTFIYNGNFIAPEQSQITTVTSNDHGMGGVTLNTFPGNQASLSLTVIPANVGIYTVDVIGTDDGAPAEHTTYPLIFNVQQCAVGITDLGSRRNSISPNPFTDVLKYSFNEKHDITITDPTGKIIFTEKNTDAGELNTSQWKNGIYFILMTSDSESRMLKLLKN